MWWSQSAITVGVVVTILALLLVCSIVEVLRLPMCAIQVFVIGVVSLKWEEDSWLATGPHRPARICCQVTMVLIPFAIFGWLVSLLVAAANEPPSPFE